MGHPSDLEGSRVNDRLPSYVPLAKLEAQELRHVVDRAAQSTGGCFGVGVANVLGLPLLVRGPVRPGR